MVDHETAATRSLQTIASGLRTALHALVAVLAVIVLAATPEQSGRELVELCLVALFLGTYALGALRGLPEGTGRARRDRLWVVALTVEWMALAISTSTAVYLVFALFFLYLQAFAGWQSVVAVALSTAFAVVAFGAHVGFTAAGGLGPVLGAAVALVFGYGYRSLAREIGARGALIEELNSTRAQLAAAERAAGVADERERLAREIHDTVSQSLSSIVMLLHVAERTDPDDARRRVRQAREAATGALAETRQFISELAPPGLRRSSLIEALTRLVDEARDTSGIQAHVTLTGDEASLASVPAPVQTAMLRVAQSSLANVVQHAEARRVDVTLTRLDDEVIIDVVDDGRGFDAAGSARSTGGDSFGLRAMRQRVEGLGGELVVQSRPGAGTSVTATFKVDR